MKSICYEYENILIGRTKKWDPGYFGSNLSETENEANALTVMRYAFDTYLNDWSIEKLMDRLDDRILRMLRLNTLVKYIRFPLGYNPNTDIFYIVSKIYRTKPIAPRDGIIRIYEKILSG